MMRIALFAFAFCFSLLCAAEEAPQTAYLFSYFTGNGEDGLHLAYSRDGLHWEALAEGKSFLTPMVGKDKLMRDPCIVQSPEGLFHMVWTTSWSDTGFGYASSSDLMQWSPQQFIPSMKHEASCKNTWAPELFYDPATQSYLVCWASTIPGRFPETEKKMGDNNHRMYALQTKDFKSFSETKLFYEPGFNVIDATLIKSGEDYVMFLKDETEHPPAKNIRIARSKRAEGPYGKVSAPITGAYWAEGPSALKVGARWIVYFDKYRKHCYGAVASTDLEKWEDISDQLHFPKGVRHGTAFQVEAGVLEALLAVE